MNTLQAYLKPKTDQARRIVRKHGSFWQVVEQTKTVSFSKLPGPWLQLVPTAERPQRTLWVRVLFDKNFDVKVYHVETLDQ